MPKRQRSPLSFMLPRWSPSDADTPAEKAYLQMLAARLNLPPDLLAHLHAAAGAAPL